MDRHLVQFSSCRCFLLNWQFQINRPLRRFSKRYNFGRFFASISQGTTAIFVRIAHNHYLSTFYIPVKDEYEDNLEKLDIVNFRYFFSDFKICRDFRRFWYGQIICLILEHCIPIGTLTYTKSSCSDAPLPISYYVLDFEVI